MRHVRAFIRLTLFIVLLPWMVLCVAIGWLLPKQLHGQMMRAVYRFCLLLFGVRVTLHGERAIPPASLVVSNHVSYVDVFVLGSLASMRFTPKAEVKSWPVIGWVLRVFKVVFVARKPSHALQQQQALQALLQAGDTICVFPEGTTTDGTYVARFKSSLFAAAAEDTPIQPIMLYYMPEADGTTPIPWYGEMTLAPHLWQFLGVKRSMVQVHILPACRANMQDRKALAQELQQHIADLHEKCSRSL